MIFPIYVQTHPDTLVHPACSKMSESVFNMGTLPFNHSSFSCDSPENRANMASITSSHASNSPAQQPTLMFNGVEERDNKMTLIQTNDCGATMIHLVEMQELWKTDMSFSYNFSHFDENVSAIVLPVYSPAQLAASFSGAQIREADDALKLLLHELDMIKRAEIVLHAIENGTNGASCTINFAGGLSRLRIKARDIQFIATGTSFVIKDVVWELEFDSHAADCKTVIPSSPLIKQYLDFLESKWIPQECLKKDSPFFALKQVVIAQHILKYVEESKKHLNFANIIKHWKIPRVAADACDKLVFVKDERTIKIWDALETGVGCAILINFLRCFQDHDVAVFLKKEFKPGSPTTASVIMDQNESAIRGMHKFGDLVETAPRCPYGGVILNPLQLFKDNNNNNNNNNGLLKGMGVSNNIPRCACVCVCIDENERSMCD
jgi:hypothetical protein